MIILMQKECGNRSGKPIHSVLVLLNIIFLSNVLMKKKSFIVTMSWLVGYFGSKHNKLSSGFVMHLEPDATLFNTCLYAC